MCHTYKTVVLACVVCVCVCVCVFVYVFMFINIYYWNKFERARCNNNNYYYYYLVVNRSRMVFFRQRVTHQKEFDGLIQHTHTHTHTHKLLTLPHKQTVIKTKTIKKNLKIVISYGPTFFCVAPVPTEYVRDSIAQNAF
jgi:hypothetical protein